MARALAATNVAEASSSTLTTQAVNLQDAIAILKMIVGLDVNSSGQAVTSYQAYAADVDGNGKVELADAITVLKRVVGIETPTASWLFFNQSGGAPVLGDNLNPGLPADLTAAVNGTTSSNVGLVAVLRGDVVGSSLSYSWALTAKPANSSATLTSATAASPTFTADLVGSYVSTMTVSDGTNSSSTSVTLTAAMPAAPGAPKISAAMAGDTTASIAFTAGYTGGLAVSYTASCSASGAATVTSSGSASPLAVAGMTNGKTYSCAITPASSAGNGSASAAVSVSPVASTNSGPNLASLSPLYDARTTLEPIASFVRDDGVVVTRIGARGRDRHAKDITTSDHYDHYLAHYWDYRTVRVQFEDYVPKGQSLIRATFITEAELGAREFRVWFWGQTTSGQFHFNPQKQEQKVSPNESGVVYHSKGTWNNDFEKVSDQGNQFKYSLDIVNKWENGGQFQRTLQAGTNMEFEISQFLLAPPAGARLNYYGTSYVYVIGKPGMAAFEWQRGVNNAGGANDGTAIPAAGLSGGGTTLGYNYSNEPAGRFMQMATNLSPGNAQPFVQGRRVHHTNFENGVHDERSDNPIWTEQMGKAGPRYINRSCASCHVRNGRALVADVGGALDKWVFKVADARGAPDPLLGSVLQPQKTGAGVVGEGDVTLGPWTQLPNGLRSPNYRFSNGTPAKFSARIAPQLVGMGLLDAVSEATILEKSDPDDLNRDGISGRPSLVIDPVTGQTRLGRFGYKAATFSLVHQVASALNTDIGVMTRMLPNPDCGSQQTQCGTAGQELSDTDFDKLVKYNSLLGVPARRDYANTVGENSFTNIGCAGCHRPTMTTSANHPLAELRSQIIHAYTDLLLHDMGEGLADNYGEGTASGAEWRTAPLWGLGHAASVMLADQKANDLISLRRDANDINRIGYLHDGRARTIEEAILWHGGEALASRQAYEALSLQAKTDLLAFLNSL